MVDPDPEIPPVPSLEEEDTMNFKQKQEEKKKQ